jgi:hypothetical protein
MSPLRNSSRQYEGHAVRAKATVIRQEKVALLSRPGIGQQHKHTRTARHALIRTRYHGLEPDIWRDGCVKLGKSLV